MTVALPFNNSFAALGNTFYTATEATSIGSPQWVIQNHPLADKLAIDWRENNGEPFLSAFSGGPALSGSAPLAMAYAGHQFGHYVDPLGDGRGLLLGEIDNGSSKWDLHLKGAGPTPYSRGGDGRAVLRSCIREYLCSEALFSLGVPTSRALCITRGSTRVWREEEEPSAMLVRVAESHIRFGSFEFFHHRGQSEHVAQLANYCIEQHFSAATEHGTQRYGQFFSAVVERTAIMIAHWQAYGFAHGVMNTDNMSILGDTFDFGPFGFLDDYQPHFICNHSDPQGRYAYSAQPAIGLWNLKALAVALSSLIDSTTLEAALQRYGEILNHHYARLMRNKLGLSQAKDDDLQLLTELLQLMQAGGSDYHNTFRQLADIERNDKAHPLREQFAEPEEFDTWLEKYQRRLRKEDCDDGQRRQQMNAINPKYVLRNYLAQNVIQQAERGDYRELERLAEVLRQPYSEQNDHAHYAQTPPEWSKTLRVSCSS